MWKQFFNVNGSIAKLKEFLIHDFDLKKKKKLKKKLGIKRFKQLKRFFVSERTLIDRFLDKYDKI